MFIISPVPECRHTDGLIATVKESGVISKLFPAQKIQK
jgi:hypothetical protein